jgi:hypothetical protein
MVERLRRGRTFLPDHLLPAHELCLLNHDVMAELLRSGEENGSFEHTFRFRDDKDRQTFRSAADVFEWLEKGRRQRERAELLRRTVFPAILSDFLHFVFEALETSRKAKLNVTFALIRKPLQESLFVLEAIAANVDEFAAHLKDNPQRLHSQSAGGLEAHQKRIASVLSAINEVERFDPDYLARLRYDKAADDGFDGICNQAIHLFTSHPAIRTESLNINFIFSGWDAKLCDLLTPPEG